MKECDRGTCRKRSKCRTELIDLEVGLTLFQFEDLLLMFIELLHNLLMIFFQ
jgi:hypothetical protein